MKKFIAVFLAFVIAFSCVTVGVAQTAEQEETLHGEVVDYGNLTWFVELPFWPINSEEPFGSFVYSAVDCFVTLLTVLSITDAKTAAAVKAVVKNGAHMLVWSVVQEATCTQDGIKTATCKSCDYTAEKAIPATGHFYETTFFSATPESSSYAVLVCNKCASRTVTEGEFVGSAWGNIVALGDVSEQAHTLSVSLSGDRIADYSNVTVKKYGKNLLNPQSFSAHGKGVSNIKVENGTISYSKRAGDAVGGISTVVYLPKGTYSLNYIAGGSVLTPCTLIESENSGIEIYRGYDVANGGISFDITTAGNYRILIYGAYSSESKQMNTISKLQLEAGFVSSYAPFVAPQQVKAGADGTVTGLTSASPDLTLVADCDAVISCKYIKSAEIASQKNMNPGDFREIGSTLLKKNKAFTFSADIEFFDKLRISHSDNGFGSSYIEISGTCIDVYYCTSSFTKLKSIEHNLTLKDDISIEVSVNEMGRMSIALTSAGVTFTKDNFSLFGGRGSIKAESINSGLTNVAFDWNSSDFNKDIWIMGDSYVSIDPGRWPYYLLASKDNFVLFGYSGAASPSLYNDFVNSLQYGKPAYAVWCLGMNEPDENGAANGQWKLYTEKFIALCQANGITPILATIPNVPSRSNAAKNEYVKNSGYRYIDFAAAVGAAAAGSSWYEGMLHSDGVHPTELGAQALAEQILKDFPELK